MRVIRIGGKYSIASGEVETYDLLPVQTYVAMYNDREGFYLTEHPNIEVQEKVYGVHESKVRQHYMNRLDIGQKEVPFTFYRTYILMMKIVN